MKTGRKPLLQIQPELIERLCSHLREGCSVRTACQASGIAESTFHDYNRRADPQQPDHEPQFVQFSERITRARGRGKSTLVSIVNKAARHDWRAALELLRSIAPTEYASRVSRDDIEALKKAEQAKSPTIIVRMSEDGVSALAKLIMAESGKKDPDQGRIARLQAMIAELERGA